MFCRLQRLALIKRDYAMPQSMAMYVHVRITFLTAPTDGTVTDYVRI